MQPYVLSIIGLSIDIVGAFFLAAEAIKIKNIRIFREQYIERVHKASLSPKIVLKGDFYYSTESKTYIAFFMGLHYVAGALILVILNYIFNGILLEWLFQAVNWLLYQRWYWILIGSIISFIYGGVFGLWMIGEGVHVASTAILKWFIILLEFIEIRTIDGMVGIIGFILLLTGFIFQIISAYAGANA